MTTNNHEVIFVIVNAGFAEEAMDVAREQGVRGGTILNARGVAREEAKAAVGENATEEEVDNELERRFEIKSLNTAVLEN